MKILIFCVLLVVSCAYPTDTQVKTNDDHHDVPVAPAAYAHRPLSHQQIPVKTSAEPVENHQLKRDVVAETKKSHVDLSTTHDNSAPSFVKPVPVEQILGKINQETHPTKVTEKPAVTHAEKVAEHVGETNDAKLTEALIKSEAKQKIEENKSEPVPINLKSPKPSIEKSESPEKKLDEKIPEQKSTDRKIRDTKKTGEVHKENEEEKGHQPVQTLPIVHPQDKDTLPIKVSSKDQPKTVEHIKPANVHSVPFNPHKEQEKIVHPHDAKEAEKPRLARDATKEVNRSTLAPHHVENSKVKHENEKETVSKDELQ